GGGRDVEERGRLEDASAAAAVAQRRGRSRPEKHLIRPLIEAAVRVVREVQTVGGLDDAVRGNGSRFEPRVERGSAAGRDRARRLRVGGQRLCAREPRRDPAWGAAGGKR